MMCVEWAPTVPGKLSVFCDHERGHGGPHEHRAIHNVTGEFIVVARWPSTTPADAPTKEQGQ